MSKTLERQLFDSARTGDLKSVKRVLLEGADIHEDDDYALRVAAQNGHHDVVDLLLKSGADVRADDDLSLRLAARYGHVGVVAALLKSGAYVHAENDYALRMASSNGHAHVVELLLKSGADIHAFNDYALLWAAHQGHTAVVDLLLKLGADTSALVRSNLLPVKKITAILSQYADTAWRGIEAVMMLEPEPCIAVLHDLHPDIKVKQIREELGMMEAMGLDAAKRAAMWKDMHGVAPKNLDISVSP